QALNLTSENTVIFKTETQEARITQFTEEKVTNALVKVLKDRSKKIYFSKGHGEPQLKNKDAESFDIVVTELENNRYEVAELSFLENPKIPDDADLVVIAGARYDLQPQEVTVL